MNKNDSSLNEGPTDVSNPRGQRAKKQKLFALPCSCCQWEFAGEETKEQRQPFSLLLSIPKIVIHCTV